ncbi:MAG: hypothetical protein GAK28_01492 [Luteibacter sp.]|uniref:GtrA family protein n=1 Tax=Luteibacter sp. TaxID=1886636 RepID=UPI001381EE47|nr:GtrA family protein [Luteibacter sp.]KAF1008015.1 MAG: hypothetical protein GAK28_01492 [Luteibacter sp.]
MIRALSPAHIRFLKFLAVGGFAAVVNFGSRIALSQMMAYAPAIVVAYCLGMITAFYLNRRLVFQASAHSVGRQAVWFVVVNLFAVIQTLAISLLLARWFLPLIGWSWYPELCAHAVGVAVPVVTSYLGHKHLSFR